ncbi:MAG: DUF2817 domain-containing protein, partial [Anaerolineaceae bacterium]|nr:DUF2817 domain-containing protein [Anaerolineaceae bacterium]MBN2677065.1 DUF2817 domain-containing protein [Anaerolineaceae bacterium]
MPSIPATYQESRQVFQEHLAEIRRYWPSACLNHHALFDNKDLSIDWILADARTRKKKLLVISTGLHGIEGYIGSAVLQLFFDEFIHRINPEITGVLFIHSQNPWGMNHWERTNPNNVDLNRNFISGEFQSPQMDNPDYPRLKSFLCPERPLGSLIAAKTRFITGLLMTLLQVGTLRLREATLMGQNNFPKGIYFTGQAHQEETGLLMDLYQRAFKGYQRIVHIDLHSGYGPRYQMTVVTSPLDSMDSKEIQKKYTLTRVAGANPNEFYSMHGDMNDWEYEIVKKQYPEASIFAANFEFGTYGDSFLAEALSLRTTILKNQMNQYGASKKTGEWVAREYRELYLPQEPSWSDKAFEDARQAFDGILNA